MALYDTGYEDERFQHPVGQTLHCNICMNVLKDPVMCGQNEHLFCRACITPHLLNAQTCPNCMEVLTVQTLCQAPRGIRNLLAELKIRCEFFDRGCGKFVELEGLERHVADCGFAPAVCSNEGCQLEVNKQDLLHHETTVCELRRVLCHNCKDIKNDMDTLKVCLVAMDEKLEKNVKKIEAVKVDVVTKVELVQEQLKKQEESNRQLKADNVEVKKNLNEIKGKLERLDNVQSEQTRKRVARVDEMDKETKVIIAGGKNETGVLDSVKMFNLSTKTWKQLKNLKKRRLAASSVVYNNQIFVIGGHISTRGSKSMETLSLNTVRLGQISIAWENSPAVLPSPLHGHCTVVYDDQMVLIGGYDGNKSTCSADITEFSLVPPYASKVLATMPQKIWHHGVALFNDKVLIMGGVQGMNYGTNSKTVLSYDITKNECNELSPLPYAVCEMAVVKWGDDNAIIVGGVDNDSKPLNSALIYNIKTQKCHRLPDLKNKRKGCVAAVVQDTVIVMGGKDERNNVLKSVECFRFDSYNWEELPEMHEGRYCATAVVC